MRSIGIRASANSIYFTIYCRNNMEIINTEEIKIPISLDTPLRLKYVRSTILDILREYDVGFACIRATETSAPNINIDRVQFEAVIQEAFASSELIGYYIGYISSISSRLKIDRKNFKPLVEGKINDLNIEGWEKLSKEKRESILSAIGATHD